MRSRRLVLVFARLPREERRAKPLVAGAPGRGVEALHGRLLSRALAAARAVGVGTRLVTTAAGPAGEAGLCRRAFPGLEIVEQVGDTFAARLERAVADAFAEGWTQLVVIGGDTPALDAGHLRRAFARLDGADGRRAVIGPACDGGYYLLGLNAFDRTAFQGIPLCTAQAGRATIEALGRAGFEVTTLAPLGDLDGELDVRALADTPGELRALAAALLRTLPAAADFTVRLTSFLWSLRLRLRGPPGFVPAIS